MNLEGTDVERLLALPLELVMVESPGRSHHGFCDRVREVHAFVQAHIAFRHRDRRPFANDDQVAGIGHGWRRVKGGHEEEVYRMLDRRALWDLDESAILEEGRVQRGQRGC